MIVISQEGLYLILSNIEPRGDSTNLILSSLVRQIYFCLLMRRSGELFNFTMERVHQLRYQLVNIQMIQTDYYSIK